MRNTRWLIAPAVLGLSALVAAPPALAASWASCTSAALPSGTAAELDLDPGFAADLDALLRDAVAGKLTQSAALEVVRRGRVAYRGWSGGARQDSIFDLASLTKVVATVPSLLQLVERGKVSLSVPASRHLSLLDADEKRAITPLQLLLHTSGFHSVVWAGPLTDGREQILSRIAQAALKHPPGSTYRYSDVGYILLGELVAAAGRDRLDEYARAHIFEPLGMCSTGFNPPPSVMPRVVSPWPKGEKPGQVYDPLAARTGGVSGHAGLFSTADDLARFALMMLARGSLGGKRILGEPALAAVLERHPLPGGRGARGLGWDYTSPHAGSKGLLSGRAYGHTGFTGTSLWIDPPRQLGLVLLTNRTFFEDLPATQAPSVSELRRRLHGAVVSALLERPVRSVETGLDRLVKNGFAELRGRRIGLITNRTAVDSRGRWIVDLLLQEPAASSLSVRALFMPEHGLAGKVDRHLGDTELRRGKERLPVYSLFGSRRRPTEETLQGIDTLVIDLQTVGARYYTYLATMGWAMEEAAKRGLLFVVLDRPNPLGGSVVQGPLSSAERLTSTNYHPLPMRYGLTLAELARYFQGERHLRVQLRVVTASGWRRDQLFSESGLPWRDPSPNIRSFRQALLYSGIGLLESTNLAVGRGTDSPFQQVGAPWIDGPALARAMNQRHLPGLYFTAVSFTPQANPYRGQLCHGVRVVVTDVRSASPPTAGVALAVELRRRHRDEWETKNLYRLINHPPTTQAILAGKDLPQIVSLWGRELERFRALRKKYLLYK